MEMAMKNVPPVLHGNEGDRPSDGNADAWPDYLNEIPVQRLIRQAEAVDATLVRWDDTNRRLSE
jgi:hypothetical protein